MKTALIVAAVVTAVGTVLGAVLDGVDGAAGAFLGGLVVVLFLGSTPLLLTPAVKASATFSPATALGFFAVKTAAVLILLGVLFDVGGLADHASPKALGLTALAVSLAWTTTQLVAFRRERSPIYDLGNKS